MRRAGVGTDLTGTARMAAVRAAGAPAVPAAAPGRNAASLGIGAAMLPVVRVESHAIPGAGGVLGDVADRSTVVGMPGRTPRRNAAK